MKERECASRTPAHSLTSHFRTLIHFLTALAPAHSLTLFTLHSTTTFCQQPADTLHLQEFEVTATRLKSFSAGTKVQAIDSTALARHAASDLGELLAHHTSVFIKTHGLGNLATTSFRGGGAGHTAVLWNGFDLNNPINGQLDLSLIPMGVADAVSVQYGGSTALWGSGAVGGAIHLNSTPRFGRGWGVNGTIGMGSFGDRRQRLRVELARDRAVTIVAAWNTEARNDFAYALPAPRMGPHAGDSTARQTNATVRQRGFIAEQHVRIAPAQRIGVRYWYHEADRHIPPTRSQAESTARQQDAMHRLMADWQRSTGRWATTVRGAWTSEQLHWYTAADAPPALSRADKLMAEAEVRYRPHARHTIDLGANHGHATAITEGYPRDAQEDRSALFAMYRHRSARGRTVVSAAMRQEWLDGRAVPFTGAVGADHHVRPWATVKAHAARLHRIPTLNDRHWRPGGDPDLLPESGYSGDLGIALHRTIKGVAVRSEVTWFNRIMDNWIIWLPGATYWSPRNIMQVWSRGVESDTELAWKAGTTTVRLGVTTSHVVSTNQVATGPHDASVDRQLIHVPMYSGHGRAGATHGRGSVSVAAHYTGYRYTSTDNRTYLEPYWLMDVSASWRAVQRSHWRADLFVHVHNLLATDYEIMPGRPMPQRHYRAGIMFHLGPANKPSHHP